MNQVQHLSGSYSLGVCIPDSCPVSVFITHCAYTVAPSLDKASTTKGELFRRETALLWAVGRRSGFCAAAARTPVKGAAFPQFYVRKKCAYDTGGHVLGRLITEPQHPTNACIHDFRKRLEAKNWIVTRTIKAAGILPGLRSQLLQLHQQCFALIVRRLWIAALQFIRRRAVS
jgi:hypothetical protein